MYVTVAKWFKTAAPQCDILGSVPSGEEKNNILEMSVIAQEPVLTDALTDSHCPPAPRLPPAPYTLPFPPNRDQLYLTYFFSSFKRIYIEYIENLDREGCDRTVTV